MGDAKATLAALLEIAGPELQRPQWRKRYQTLVSKWRDEHLSQLESDAIPMRPERLCREIGRALPSEAVLVSDTGHAGIWSGTMVELTSPTQRYIRAAGSLGWGFPASIGVKCALPDTPVICFTGDGGFLYHIAELETAARIGANVVVVVNDNHSWSGEKPFFDQGYGGHAPTSAENMWIFRTVDYAKLAESMGCIGLRAETPSELANALSTAMASDRPAVIDAISDMQVIAPIGWS
jgi:acetolactate synthase-1/2/3 large subunit